MRQLPNYIGLFFILVSIQCSRTTKDSQINLKAIDSIKRTNVNEKGPPPTDTTQGKKLSSSPREVTIIVKDSTKYSRRFLNGLREGGPGTKFELVDNLIITDDRYRNVFDQVLPDNKDITLKAERNGNIYRIKVRQVNLTTISYDFELIDNKGQKMSESGEADRSPQFMLGSETDIDENEKAYATFEYFTQAKCLLSIRLGILDKQIVGRLSGCNDNLDYFKTLTLR